MHGTEACFPRAAPLRAPELELQAGVAQRLELLVVLVVADGDDGQLGALDRRYQVGHPAAVARRHAVHLVHHQAQLRAGATQSAYSASIIRVLVGHATASAIRLRFRLRISTSSLRQGKGSLHTMLRPPHHKDKQRYIF